MRKNPQLGLIYCLCLLWSPTRLHPCAHPFPCLLTLPLNSKVHGYADDTTFYLSNSSPSLLQDLVSSDIALIEKWCESNMMVLNETKSHYLVVNQQNYPFSFSVNNTVLQKQPTTKLLGFVINSTLAWSDHIDTISKKVSANLRLFYNIRHLIDFSTLNSFTTTTFTHA